MPRILVIDDDPGISRLISALIEEMGYESDVASTGQEARELAAYNRYDVIFLDVYLPDINGLDLLPEARNWTGNPEVVIITGAGDADGAELAIKSGAWDYIQKSSSLDAIMLSLNRAIQYREKHKTLLSPVRLKREGIIGESKEMRACLDLIARAASTEASTLITGESGTGKELFANAIHKNSERAKGPFIIVDCAALPDALVEGILFGHKKGSFTGADGDRIGLVRRADGGTLFLDEVGEMPLQAQSSLLRVLQERRFRPIGAGREVESNFRVIAATNQDLETLMKTGKFRLDLLFRLKSITIHLPPLRSRADDVVDLAVHHIKKLCVHYGLGIKGLSEEYLAHLKNYSWPGNVRELVNVLEHSIANADKDETLYPNHLPENIRISFKKSSLPKKESLEEIKKPDKPSILAVPKWKDFKEKGMSELEQEYIIKLLTYTRGNVSEACEISGLSRARIYQLIKKHGADRPKAFKSLPIENGTREFT